MVNYNENVYVRRGVDGRSHIPALPFWMAIIRVVQLVLIFLVLILCAYASATFSGTSDSGEFFVQYAFPGYNMSFFTFSWTVLFILYIFLTPLVYPKLYNSYAHLGLEFLTVIFWLTSFALLADETKYWSLIQKSYENYKNQAKKHPTYYDSSETKDADKYISASKSSRAATGFAAIVWLLFMVTFGFVVYFWNKHRTEHGETGVPFGHSRGPADPEANQVEKQNANVELHNVQQEQPHPQQQYPQQPYPQQQYQQPQHQAPVA